MGAYTSREKAKCAEREVGQRKYVYGKRVQDGRMAQDKADREIALMAEIAAEYTALAEEEERQGRLF